MTELLLILCLSGAVAAVGYVVAQMALSRPGEKLRERLVSSQPNVTQKRNPPGLIPLLQRIGVAAAEPFMPKSREKQSSLRRNLAQAGYYAPVAVKLVTGAKVLLLAGGLFSGYVIGLAMDNVMLGVAIGMWAGYVLPTMWLRAAIKANQRALTYGLPDALDLMVVCVEAGLTIDAALQRVGQELAVAHPAIARELGIAHMETRVGLPRAEALRNLGQRTGNPSLVSLSSMLIQSERFGTSVAQSLRVHAESLRSARQHAAEEMAAKASVKLNFPLVLFIFPATFIILAGPVVLQMMENDFFK